MTDQTAILESHIEMLKRQNSTLQGLVEDMKCCGNCHCFDAIVCGEKIVSAQHNNLCDDWTWDGILAKDRVRV